MAPHFTILVPTRNRSRTLASTLRSCLTQDYADFEVVVSDNMSDDDTSDVVRGLETPRLRYVRTSRRLSMTGNFEHSLSLARAGYVMHLGDDDGLVPGALKTAAGIIGETGVKAVTSSAAIYHWPDSLHDRLRNTLTARRRDTVEIRDARKIASDVIAFRRPYSELPSTYSGFVHTDVINRARSADGIYYHSITPDSYSGFANAAVMSRYAFTTKAFAIAGLSGRSNGAAHAGTKPSLEASLYERENDLAHHSGLPQCLRSVPYVVAEAFLQARDHVPDGVFGELEYDRLAKAALCDATPESFPEIRGAVMGLPGMASVPARPSASLKAGCFVRRQSRRLAMLAAGYRRVDCSQAGVTDVEGAGRLLSSWFPRVRPVG